MEKGFDTLLCLRDNYPNMSALSVATQSLEAIGVMATTRDHLPEFILKIPYMSKCYLYVGLHGGKSRRRGNCRNNQSEDKGDGFSVFFGKAVIDYESFDEMAL